MYRRRLPHGAGFGLEFVIRAGETSETDGDLFTSFVASTADVDRMGDIVDQRTWRLARWRLNPVILHEHGIPVVGKGKARVNREKERLEIRVQWDIGDHNPVASLVARQHQRGFRHAGSVGFIPGKAVNRRDLPDDDPRKASEGTPRWRAGSLFSHAELLEFSPVAIPANAAALQLQNYAGETEDPVEAAIRIAGVVMTRDEAAQIVRAALADPSIRTALAAVAWGDPAPVSTTSGDWFADLPE